MTNYAKTLRLDIVSAERAIFSGQVTMVLAIGSEGELGIAPGHSQLLTRLGTGDIRALTEAGKEEIFYVCGGTLEVQPDAVTVLADTSMRAEELDEQAALAAKQHAEESLAGKHADMDIAKAQAELAQAIAQIKIIQKMRKLVK